MENTILYQIQGFVHCLPEDASIKDIVHILSYLNKESYGDFVLSEDNENPNEVRSAGIRITHHLSLPTGTLLYGEKVGRLSWEIESIPFRSILLFFPTPDDTLHFQKQEPYCSNRAIFLQALSERMVLLVDLQHKVHKGLGKHLLMGQFKEIKRN